MTEIDFLFGEIDEFSYPDTMKMVKGEIPGIAFFPGGKGTFKCDDIISDKEIMIIGQDFDCERNYNRSLANGKEDITTNPTWKNLLSMLERLEIPPDNCFFTNAILGIRKSDLGTGRSPAFKDPAFIKNCHTFFLSQLKVQKPKVILVLGKFTAEFLAGSSEDLTCWSKIKSFRALDDKNLQIKKNIVFSNGIESSLVVLTHPSYRQANVFRRAYKGIKEGFTEIKMIQEVL